MGDMSPMSRLAPLILLALPACTTFVVPDDQDSGGGGGGSTAASTEASSTSDAATSGANASAGSDGGTTTTGPATTTSASSDPTNGSGPVTSDTSGEPPPPIDCDFPTTIEPILANCSCHTSDTPPKGLVLSPGTAYSSLVNVDSAEQPGTPRVAPGDPGASWLVTKLKPAPPVGDQMPVGGMMPPEKLALIEAWIAAGAPTGAFACDGGGNGGAGSVTIDEQGPAQVEVGEMLDLDVTVLDGQGQPVQGATVKWISSDEPTLYVDGKGTLLGLAPGTSQVTAEVDGVVSAPVAVTVTVNDPAPAPFADVLGVLTTRCGCHNNDMPPVGLGFNTGADAVYAALLAASTQVPDVNRVVKDSPGQSYLFQKLTLSGPTKGEQMPKGNAPLEAEKVQSILRWILAGAPQ